MTIFRQDEFVYLVGRAAALGSRPAYLLLCNHFFGNSVAAIVASVFLISAVLNGMAGFDVHRTYYARHFGDAPGSAAKAYVQYTHAQLLICIVAMLFGGAFFLITGGSALLAVAGGIFAATERLADEVLRYALFNRARARWGWLMICRVGFQMKLIALVVILNPAVDAAALVACALLLGNAFAFGRYCPMHFFFRLARRIGLLSRRLREAFQHLALSSHLWFLSLATMMSGFLDRIIVLRANKDELAAFSLVVVSLAVVQNTVEYFYFSQRRRDFLEGTVRFDDVMRSRLFWMLVLGSLVVGLLLTAASAWLYRGGPEIGLVVVLLVAIEQVIIATSSIPREIAYWNNQIGKLIKIEMIFLALIALMFGFSLLVETEYVWLLAFATCALAARLILLAGVGRERISIM
jgi:hypothetical protein